MINLHCATKVIGFAEMERGGYSISTDATPSFWLRLKGGALVIFYGEEARQFFFEIHFALCERLSRRE